MRRGTRTYGRATTIGLLQRAAHATAQARREAIAARADKAIIAKLTRTALAANEALRTETRVAA